MTRETGSYVDTATSGEAARAFVPRPLPPDPALEMTPARKEALGRAHTGLARLRVACRMAPSPGWLIHGFVRREAVISSRIEGVQATLTDLLAFEAEAPEPAPTADVMEVRNHVAALAWARGQIASPRGIPLSLRLLKETHRRLMKGARGGNRRPGEFRRIQSWIGGPRPGEAGFVPPPPDRLGECLDALEKYLHDDDGLPPLVRAGLVHVQFGTIHPFPDGNGRLGRILIGLLLEHWKLLEEPLLCLSLHLRRNQREYDERIDAVRTAGDWEGWTDFFLDGVASAADQATLTAQRLYALYERDRAKMLDAPGASLASLKLLSKLPRNPIVTIARVVRLIGTTKPTATKAVSQLVEGGVLKETTGRRRDRAFAYRRYLALLSEGTEAGA